MAPKKIQKKQTQPSRRYTKKKKKETTWVKDEIAGLLIITLSVLMVMSLYFNGSAGPFGELIGRQAGGFFGFMGYFLPPVLLIYGVVKTFKPNAPNKERKLFLALIMLAFISAIFQAGLHDVTFYKNMGVTQYISHFYKEGIASIGKSQEAAGASGGLLGGLIGVPLLFVFRKLGTLLILIVMAIISALLLTRLSLSDAAKSFYHGTTDAINGMKDAIKQKKQDRTMMKTFNLSQEAAAEAPKATPQGKKKQAKVIDFPLHEVNQSHLEEPPSPVGKPTEAATIDIKSRMNGRAINEAHDQSGLYGQAVNDAQDQTFEAASIETENSPIESFPVEKPARKPRTKAAAEAKAQEESKPENENASPLADLEKSISETNSHYLNPPVELLTKSAENEANYKQIRSSALENAKKLEGTLESFGIGAKVSNISVGPAFTRFELQPAPGIKVSRIVNLTDDIALNLAAAGVRIEAPIPGKAAIGVEIPNKEVAPIGLRSVLESQEFTRATSNMAVALGKDISGENVVIDLAKMPHILIAGATGSGKSVCINSIVISILYKASPDLVKVLMIDPKMVELGVYNGIPHLLIPVVTDPNKAAGALRWAVSEMTTRYKLFAEKGVRDLTGFNTLMTETDGIKLPQIVIIIDELADLMMVAPHDVEDSICRLAQMARAAGMHLVIATQRPSVNVITGVIKANIPSRIAFSVSSQVDSRTILDMAGAEKLLGRGDMLYYPVGIPKPIRVKGAFVSDKEVELVVDFVKNQMRVRYDEEIIENINEVSKKEDEDEVMTGTDELLERAIEAVIDCGQASVSFIQRKFKVGYARAGRMIDQMAELNIISGFEGSKPRRVLVSRERWNEMKMTGSGEGV